MNSIARKVLISLTAALVVVFLISSVVSYQLQSSSEHENWQATKQTLQNELRVILTEPVYAYDRPLIESIIKAFTDDQNINKISVYDHRDIELGQTGKSDEYSEPVVVIPLEWEGSSIGQIKLELSSILVEARNSSSMMNILLSLGLFVLMTGVFSMLIVNKLVVTPLTSVNALLADVAGGGGDLTKRINYQSNDEIGQLVTGFNQFIGQVQVIISDAAETAQGLEKVARLVQKAGEQSKKEVEQEYELTESALVNLSQLSAATDDIASNASQAASNSDIARETSKNSQQFMGQNVEQVSNLKDELNQTSQVVGELHAASSNISSVLDVIKNIAEQTNLLALNAAIEAARAGEQGRGFAVVADEVRTLAQRTQDSTKEIEDIITALQSQAQNSVSATQRSQELAELVIESSQAASGALNEITAQMDNISDMNNLIATASEQQTMVTNEVKSTMDKIHDGAEHLSQEAGQLEDSIHQLSDLESRLMSKIQEFKY